MRLPKRSMFASYWPQVTQAFDAGDWLPLFAIKAVHWNGTPPKSLHQLWLISATDPSQILTGLCGRRASAVALRPEACELRSPHALDVAQHLGR